MDKLTVQSSQIPFTTTACKFLFLTTMFICYLSFSHSLTAQQNCYALDSQSVNLSRAILANIDYQSIVESKRTEPFAILIVLEKKEGVGYYQSIGTISASKYYSDKIYTMMDSMAESNLQHIAVPGQDALAINQLFIQPLLFNHANHFGAQVSKLPPKYDLCSYYYYDKSLGAIISALQLAGNASLLYPILMEGDKRVIR